MRTMYCVHYVVRDAIILFHFGNITIPTHSMRPKTISVRIETMIFFFFIMENGSFGMACINGRYGEGAKSK